MILKLAMIFIIFGSAFNLGRYSVQFSGRSAAWVSVVCSIVAIIAATVSLLGQ